ncbi:MAG: ferrous iron transport protein A [Mycoplasmataceae bacterium]|jgi:Fe2+ transport system protein FeoA|nr:ferrous iron transport protein A [Mycoplasmataceae bacterium]
MQLTYHLKGKVVEVTDVKFKDEHIVHKINNIGITRNTIIKVLDYDKDNTILHLLVYGVEYVLRAEECRYINVREYKDNKQFQCR